MTHVRLDTKNTKISFTLAEEVFSDKVALWLSPDGNKLAYVRFDDEPVRQMEIPIYGVPGIPYFQYPEKLSLNYPKVNTNYPLFKFTINP